MRSVRILAVVEGEGGRGLIGASEGDTVEMKLVCSLDDLYTGCMRKVKISRIVIDDFGRSDLLNEKEKMVTFPGKGDQMVGMAPGDLEAICSSGFILPTGQHIFNSAPHLSAPQSQKSHLGFPLGSETVPNPKLQQYTLGFTSGEGRRGDAGGAG